MYYVYILKSDTSGHHYVGVTKNPERRLFQHNNGLNTLTRGKGPWIILWQSGAMNRKAALQLERTIKKRGAIRWLSDHGKS